MPSNAATGTTRFTSDDTGAEVIAPRPQGGDEGATIREPLIVTRGAAGFAGIACPYLGHDVQIRWPVNGEPTAVLGVKLARDGWGVDIAGDDEAPQIRPLRHELHDGHVIRVETAHADPTTNLRLFEGFIERINFGASAAADEHERRAQIACVGLMDELRRSPEHHIYGQHQVSKGQREALAEGAIGVSDLRPALYTGLPAIINPGGRGNRLSLHLQLPFTDSGTVRFVPVFCDPRDALAKSWSYAHVLMYLLTIGRLTASGAIGEWTQFGFRDAPIEVFGDPGATQPTLPEYISGFGLLELDPDTIGPQEDPWKRVLLAKPVDLVLQHLSWLDALKMVCLRAGLWYRWDPLTTSDGEQRWHLRFLLPHAARRRSLLLPSRSYTTHDKEWSTVREHANVEALDMGIDYGGCTNLTQVRGAANAQEVTVELVPGWTPDARWDVAPGGEAAALKYAASDAHYENYGGGAALRPDSEHAFVGRRWGLNTLGAWPKASYGRAFGPYSEDRYALFDLADVQMGGGPSYQERGVHALRRRVFRACLTGADPNTPHPPLVEVSVDSGGTWHVLPGDVRISTRDLRLLVMVDDLRTIAIADDNYVRAYINKTLRLRITATIEDDDDLATERIWLDNYTASHRTRFGLQAGERWAWRDRDFAGYGNSQFKSTSLPQLFQADDSAAYREAGRFLQATDRVAHRGLVRIPWLEWPAFGPNGMPLSWLGYLPGDVIDGVQSDQAAGAESAWDWPFGETADPAFPVCPAIAATTWVVNLLTPAEMTLIEIGDPQQDVRFEMEDGHA